MRRPRRTPAPGPAARRAANKAVVGILYENDEWLDDLFERLAGRGVPYRPVRMDDAAVLLDEPPLFPVVFNRVSPSSYLRGHGSAISYARSLLNVLDEHGQRTINGSGSFAVETSKVAQLLLLRRLGVPTPRTILFNNGRQVAELARDLRYPAILKPDCGGSGAYIRRVRSYEHLLSLLEQERDLFGPDHLLLLQPEFVAGDGGVVRAEFIDGELIYAMRVHATNTFNLCPAQSCERHAADPQSPKRPHVEFEPYPRIPAPAVAQAREIVRGAHLDVGGVEFVQSSDGTRTFFDINATSVYRPEICRALGVDALGKLVDFIDREFHKEVAKRGRAEVGSSAPGRAPSERRVKGLTRSKPM